MYGFALIGCGRIGTKHAEQIAAVGKLLAVCDVAGEKAEALAQQYGAKAYTYIDDLLEAENGVQVVSVCTPNGLHAEHAIKSLQNGRHVLCEKPLCIASSAAWSMMDTAYFFRRQLFVVKQNRYNTAVQFVKSLLNENKLGRILSFQINCFWNRPQAYYTGDWRGTLHNDGGLLYTQFSHFIDLLYWFLGDVQNICGYKKNNGLRQHFEIEDSGTVALSLHSGAVGTLNYTINSYDHNQEGSFTLFGEKGSVKIGGQYLNTIEWLQCAQNMLPPAVGDKAANDYGFYTGSMSNHHLVYADIIKALDGQPHSLPHIKDAVKTVEIIEKIYKHSLQL